MNILDLNSQAGGSICAIKQLGDHRVQSVESNPTYIETLIMNTEVEVLKQEGGKFMMEDDSDWDIITARFEQRMYLTLSILAGTYRPKAIILSAVRPNKETKKTLTDFCSFVRGIGYTPITVDINCRKYGTPLDEKMRMVVCTTPAAGTIPLPKPRPMGEPRLREYWEDLPIDCLGEVFPPQLQSWYSLIPEGGCIRDLPIEEQNSYYEIAKMPYHTRDVLHRLSMRGYVKKLPVNPVAMQSPLCHPLFTRPPSIREYARIKGFPDSWLFSKELTAQYKQIAVTPSPEVLRRFYKPVFEAVERLQ